MAVTTETFESAYDAARAQLAPRLRHAQETVTPVVADLVATARERGGEIARAARGIQPETPRRWPLALAGFAGGIAVGTFVALAVRRMFAVPATGGSTTDETTFGETGFGETRAPQTAEPQEREYVRTMPAVSDTRGEVPAHL